jgi:hypothetical protein
MGLGKRYSRLQERPKKGAAAPRPEIPEGESELHL